MELPKSIGRYEILDWVGRGGMGVLYRAQDPVLERDVAIKVMAADFSDDEVGRSRFYREARAVARLQHRNIVTLYDFGEEQGAPYIVMEFLRGQTLAARLRTGPPLSVDEALDIAAQLGTGLHFAHAHGIIHRDVKPANIWLLDDGGVKLLDFGIAKFGESTLTTAGDVVGSVSYMSPEQLSGAPVDGRSDIFSGGIVLYELLTGRRPFHGDTPTAIMMRIIHDDPAPIDSTGSLPEGLSDIVLRALAKQVDRRYQHGAELASDLQALRATLGRTLSSTRAGMPTQVVAVPPISSSSSSRSAVSRPQSLIETGEDADVSGPLGGRESSVSRSRPMATRQPSLPLEPARASGSSSSSGSGSASRSRQEPPSQGTSHGRMAASGAGAPVNPADDLDLLGDVPIGELAPTPRPFRAAPTSARRWLPAGAAAGALLAAIIGFFIVRDGTSGASGVIDGKASAPASEGRAANPADGAATRRAGAGGAGTGASTSDAAAARERAARESNARTATDGERDARGGASAARDRAAATRERETPASRVEPPASRRGNDRASADRRGEPEKEEGPAPPRGSPASQAGFIVSVTGPYAFEVITEGGVTSRKSTRHELTLVGKQTLRLRAPEYALDRRIPVVPPPDRGELRLSAPTLGRLTLRASDETCEVLANGRSLGFPPIVEQPLASGSYHLVMSCPDGEKRTQNVTIAGGRTETVLIR